MTWKGDRVRFVNVAVFPACSAKALVRMLRPYVVTALHLNKLYGLQALVFALFLSPSESRRQLLYRLNYASAV